MSSQTAPGDGIILASGSPRRHDLLAALGFEFAVFAPDVDESQHHGETVVDHIQRVAMAKFITALQRFTHVSCIVAADTTVWVQDQPMVSIGKPKSLELARRTLSDLSGRSHLVSSHFVVGNATRRISKRIDTQVTFRELGQKEIDDYLKHQEWIDKAGGYAIQGLGRSLVARLEGSYTNVIGLPVDEVGVAISNLLARS